MTPSQLFNNLVTVNKNVFNLYRVVTTCNEIRSRCEIWRSQPGELDFRVGVLPTYAIVSRILLLLIVKSLRLRWNSIPLYSLRAAVVLARLTSPCCVRSGVGPGFDGWIKRVCCNQRCYRCSIRWGHVYLEPDELEPSWRRVKKTAALRKLITKMYLHRFKKEGGPKSFPVCVKQKFTGLESGSWFALLATDCSRLLQWHFKRASECVWLFLAGWMACQRK